MEWATAACFLLMTALLFVSAVRRRGPSTTYPLIAVAAACAVCVLAAFNPASPGNPVADGLVRAAILLFITYAWALYRFAFAMSAKRLRQSLPVVDGLCVAAAALTLLIPGFPQLQPGQWPGWALVYWCLMVVVLFGIPIAAALRLRVNSRHQATAVRSRLRILAGSSALLTLGLIVSTMAGSTSTQVNVMFTEIVAVLAGGCFALAAAAPQSVRASWLRPQRFALTKARADMAAMTDGRDLARRALAPMCELAGSTRGAYLPDDPESGPVVLRGVNQVRAGLLVASHAPARRYPIAQGEIIIWESPLWPFTDAASEQTTAALAGLLERCLRAAAEPPSGVIPGQAGKPAQESFEAATALPGSEAA